MMERIRACIREQCVCRQQKEASHEVASLLTLAFQAKRRSQKSETSFKILVETSSKAEDWNQSMGIERE
jgi:hypothetical protein